MHPHPAPQRLPDFRFVRSVVVHSLRPQGLQHAKLPCSSPTPGACSNSGVHPIVIPSNHLILCRPLLPLCLKAFPASGSLPMSQFLTSGDQSIGTSASVLPMNIQYWFPLGWTGWISLQSKELSRVFSNTTAQQHQFFSSQWTLYFRVHLSHLYTSTGKTIALTRRTFVSKVMSLFLIRCLGWP